MWRGHLTVGFRLLWVFNGGAAETKSQNLLSSGEYLVIFKCALDSQMLSWRHEWWSEDNSERCTFACEKGVKQQP